MGSKQTSKATPSEAAAMQKAQADAHTRRLRRKLARAPLEDHEGYRAFIKACIGDVAWAWSEAA